MVNKILRFLFTIFIGIIMFFTSHKLLNLEVNNDIEEIKDSNNEVESMEIQKQEKVYEVGKKGSSLYEVIEKGLINGDEKINLIGIDGDKSGNGIFQILEDVTKNNPEIMYYSGAKYSKGILWPNYEKDREEIKLHQKIIREKRKDILSEIINPNMTDYNKVKAVHDYIINTTRYDKAYFQNEEVKPESHTVYGVLVEGVAVCDGYAKAMKYLLEPLDIETIIVNGKSKGMNHAWNIVKIEDEYYHIDATWNDPVTEDGQDIIVYDYFNLKDEDIAKTHSWNKDKYPQCTSTKYNYYYYNNLLVNNYEEFYSLLKDTLVKGRKSISYRILNYDKEIYNISNTVENIVNENILSYKAINFNYSINEELGIITINFEYK